MKKKVFLPLDTILSSGCRFSGYLIRSTKLEMREISVLCGFFHSTMMEFHAGNALKPLIAGGAVNRKKDSDKPLTLTLLTRDAIWTLFQRFLNVKDARWKSNQYCVLIGSIMNH